MQQISSKPLLNSFNSKQIERYVHELPHALIVFGDATKSAATVCSYIAERYCAQYNLPAGDVYVIGEGGVPGIDEIRQAKTVVRSRARGEGLSRIVVINSASEMKDEAQNALLKMIEEPVAGVVYVIASERSEAILPTVVSRCVELVLRRPGVDELAVFTDGRYTDSQMRLALSACKNLQTIEAYLNGGAPGMDYAKRMLSVGKFERMATVSDLAKDRPGATLFIENIQVLCRYLYLDAIRTKKESQIKKYESILKLSIDVSDAITRNGNLKLNLIRLLYSM